MTRPVRRLYNLNGVGLTVEAADESHAAFLDPILGQLTAARPVRHHWKITITKARAVVRPAVARAIWDGPLPEGLPSILTTNSGWTTLTVPDHFAMTNRRATCSSRVRVTSAGQSSIQGTAAFWLIDEILAARNRHLLHGACLVKAETDQAIALFAPSGTGKTTTALALARNGLGLAGDDALVLHNAKNASYVWGIPRAIKVSRRTADMLPWLAPVLAPHKQDEQALRFGDLEPIVKSASTARRRCAAIVVLMKPNGIGHRAEMIAKADALTHIVADNIRRAPTGVDVKGQAAFAAIARLVRRTPTIILSVGPDPCSLTPELILSAIRFPATTEDRKPPAHLRRTVVDN
ncbi:MAG: hypothetical protein ACLPWG_14925 [Steroidobacteraceae bacterium]